jgi:hypothetical protein
MFESPFRRSLPALLLAIPLVSFAADHAVRADASAHGVLSASAITDKDFNTVTCDAPLQGDLCIRVHCPACGGAYGAPATQAFAFTLPDSVLPAGYGQCTINDLNPFVVLSQSQVGDLADVAFDRNGAGGHVLFVPGGSCGSTLDATFDDSATTAADACPATGGLVLRSHDGTLSALDDTSTDATWSVSIDNKGPSTGTVSDFGFAADISCAVKPGQSPGCTPDANTVCLNNGRFKVTATFQAPNAAVGDAHAIALTTDTGWMWFFNAANVEMVVKVLNGCGVNNRYWVFAGGLTNVRVVLTVEDTVKHLTRTYVNPQRTAFQPIQDTRAFATCP